MERSPLAETNRVSTKPPMTAPGWLIETMNVEPVARQSESKHSAWKYMIAANGPIRSDVPQCDNNIGDYDYHECNRGIDSLTAYRIVAPRTGKAYMAIQTSNPFSK